MAAFTSLKWWILQVISYFIEVLEKLLTYNTNTSKKRVSIWYWPILKLVSYGSFKTLEKLTQLMSLKKYGALFLLHLFQRKSSFTLPLPYTDSFDFSLCTADHEFLIKEKKCCRLSIRFVLLLILQYVYISRFRHNVGPAVINCKQIAQRDPGFESQINLIFL